MDVGPLISFRAGFRACLAGWGDTLFELCDAVLTAPGPVSSIPALSLEAPFRRSHGSLYKALAVGGIDTDRLRRLLIAHRPAGWPSVFAVDASTWDRCDAETSPERGFYYSATRHSAGQPIVAGWSYQWLCQLNWAPDSWTAPLDITRIAPTDDTVTATVAQISRVVELLDNDAEVMPMFVFDAGYDPIAITEALSNIRAQTLTRISSARVFHPDPPTRTAATMGRPRRHGPRFALNDRTTWPAADQTHTTDDPRYGTITVTAWHDYHPKLHGRGRWTHHDEPPIVHGNVIRVEVEHLPKPTARTTKHLWLWHSGPEPPDLELCWRAYLRRFDIEHTFRFLKHTLGWTTPSVCTPEQADRWTWLTAAAYTQLQLARRAVNDHRLPWERPREPARLTPARVRREFRRLAPTIGTPAHPPKPSRAGPGRPKGTRRPPRTRHPAIKKTADQV